MIINPINIDEYLKNNNYDFKKDSNQLELLEWYKVTPRMNRTTYHQKDCANPINESDTNVIILLII